MLKELSVWRRHWVLCQGSRNRSREAGTCEHGTTGGGHTGPSYHCHTTFLPSVGRDLDGHLPMQSNPMPIRWACQETGGPCLGAVTLNRVNANDDRARAAQSASVEATSEVGCCHIPAWLCTRSFPKMTHIFPIKTVRLWLDMFHLSKYLDILFCSTPLGTHKHPIRLAEQRMSFPSTWRVCWQSVANCARWFRIFRRIILKIPLRKRF